APGRAPGTAGARRRAAPRSRTASRARSAARRGSDPVPRRAAHRRRASAWAEARPRPDEGAAEAGAVVARAAVRRAPAPPSRALRACRGRYRARRRSCAPSGDSDHVLDHLSDDLFSDLLHALGVPDQQGDVAQVVDLARGAPREIEDELDRFLGEEPVRLSGHPQPMADVARGVRAVERVEVIPEADPLVEMLATA